MNIVQTKALVGLLFCIVRIVFGLLPLKIYKCLKKYDVEEEGAQFVNQKREKQVFCFLAMFQSFSGGVLFATCFLHMMHELYLSLHDLLKAGDMSSKYPYSQLIVSFGFFLVYFIEEAAQWLISRLPDEPLPDCLTKKGHSAKNQVAPVITDLENTDKLQHELEGTTILDDTPNNFPEKADNENEEASNNNTDVDKQNALNLELVSNDVEQIAALENIIEKENKTQQQILRGLLIILALCLHSFFEGLAIGLQVSISNIIYLFIAISIHSATILFCLSLELLLANTRIKTICIHVLILSISSPIGVFLGLAMSLNADTNHASRAQNLAIVLLEGLSTGTILYITFFEVLNREKDRRQNRMKRAFCILLGFALMAILEIFEI